MKGAYDAQRVAHENALQRPSQAHGNLTGRAVISEFDEHRGRCREEPGIEHVDAHQHFPGRAISRAKQTASNAVDPLELCQSP
jgi:hypothetical protein